MLILFLFREKKDQEHRERERLEKERAGLFLLMSIREKKALDKFRKRRKREKGRKNWYVMQKREIGKELFHFFLLQTGHDVNIKYVLMQDSTYRFHAFHHSRA